MKINTINKNISILNYDTDDNFVHKTSSFESYSKNEDIYLWFDPNNNYPDKVIHDIRKGTTLESILFEDLIYKTGSEFNGNDQFLNYLKSIQFKNIFRSTNDHFNKLANVFVLIIVDEKDRLQKIDLIQPQKCRLTNDSKVVITDNWKDFKKKNAETIPIYPKFKSFSVKNIKLKKSVYHIKNNPLGFDHYGYNEKMEEALLLNEKEHRRNNWQLSQIKRGFKRDFFLVSDYPLTEKEKKKADEAFKKASSDDYAGGVEAMEGENAKLVPAQANYDFDFTKDDTSDQIFLKMGFPRSLIGIKSGAAFSVEQVESDYDQYLPKVENQQTFLLNEFSNIFKNHLREDITDWSVINNPPAIVLQNYMQYMNDEQKSKVIDKVFLKYGIE